ncbi:hypothetical protein [Sphingopyxis sp.]|uniref:hypothetical protein n=1 Tax=Sphingopyxis sp. TaxID=1908224 RepID=UPI003D0C3FF9
MITKEPERASEASRPIHDRIVDWLGAQGALSLTIYMCGIVALVAYIADVAG